MIVRAEGHVSEVQGGPVGDGCADRGGCGGDARDRAGKCIRHDVPGTNTRMLGYIYSDMNARWRCWWPDVGGDILLLAKIRGLRPVVGSKLERPACNCKSGAEMFDT